MRGDSSVSFFFETSSVIACCKFKTKLDFDLEQWYLFADVGERKLQKEW